MTARAVVQRQQQQQQALRVEVTPLPRYSVCGRKTPCGYDRDVRGGGVVRVALCGDCAKEV